MTYNLKHQRLFLIAGRMFISAFLMTALVNCAAPLVAGVPTVVLTEVLPRTVNGKGLAEDGADLATDKDCRVIEGVLRKNRKFCENNNSSETRKDFKGLSGMDH